MPKKNKVGRPRNRSRSGRPAKMTPEAIAKLEQAFALGCSDLEACLLADMSKDTLYRYQKENPEFCERKEKLKETPILLARQSVITGLHGNGELALKFLERRKKDEFSTKVESENIHTFKVMGEVSMDGKKVTFDVGRDAD